MGLIGLIFSYILSEMITLILQRNKYYKLFPNDKILWGIPDKNLFRSMFAFGLTFMIMSIASKLSSSSDSIILGNILGASAVSIYYVSQMPGTILYQLIWKITDNSAPALNELYFQGNKIQFNEAYFKMFRYSLLLTAPLIIGLITFNKNFITMWAGSDHYAGTIFTIALTFYAFTQVFIHLNAIVFVAIGKIKVMSLVTIFLSVTKVVMSYFFINKLGIKGLMIINAILDVPILFILQYIAFREMKISKLNFFSDVIKPVFKSNILLFIFCFIIFFFINSTNIYTFTFEIALFILITATSIYIFGINKVEKIQVAKMTSNFLSSKNSSTNHLSK
jgi:O-antigen/teichoic acid export membrane protein